MEKNELRNRVIWDYNIDADTFLAILRGEKSEGWFTQDWALVRVIERLNYYDMLEVVPFEVIARRWPELRKKIRFPDVRKGLDYAVRKYSLPASG